MKRPAEAGRHDLVDSFATTSRFGSVTRTMAAAPGYSIRVSVPVAISAAAQITSRLNQARRSMPTPSFSNTSTAMNAVTAR